MIDGDVLIGMLVLLEIGVLFEAKEVRGPTEVDVIVSIVAIPPGEQVSPNAAMKLLCIVFKTSLLIVVGNITLNGVEGLCSSPVEVTQLPLLSRKDAVDENGLATRHVEGFKLLDWISEIKMEHVEGNLHNATLVQN